MKLRDYQRQLAEQGAAILKRNNLVYYAIEVRCGKTVIALETARLNGFKNVLFVTKKKATSSITDDYNAFGYSNNFDLTVINYESIHKLTVIDFDMIILDEAHKLGAFPKPGTTTKRIREQFSHLPMIYLSGTPSPESYSQFFHQFYVSEFSPFRQYANFYKWAKDFVNVRIKYVAYGQVKDYSDADYHKIKHYIDPLMITYTQKQAGFSSNVDEEILYIPLSSKLETIIKLLIKDKLVQGKNDVILADTAVKLQSKLHQLYSGTVKFESGKSMVIDTSKAEFIKRHFDGKKLAIFYKFKEEYQALKSVFINNITDDLEEFNNSSKHIALQIVSGREGISLSKADYLVYYNIDFSAVSYWQSRDRLTTKDRQSNKVFWIFTKNGIEDKIYKAVANKKNYTLKIFKKDYGV